ncbi:hypothetical protein FKW77_000708 [Venturia effusa]|uniref:Myb-like domain-containing protein n=1 Tax=Venturia effusa TaxID=50376 RepID=A0A517L2P0_9PEZI|nr:hypothetical protein FKW77_000708 [Venturia effusa]
MSHHQPSYGPGPSQTHIQYAPQSRKRSRPHDDLQLDLQGLTGLTSVTDTGQNMPVDLNPHAHHAQPQQNLYQQHQQQQHHHQQQQQHQQQQSLAPPQHHHHRLPNQPPPSKMRRMGYGDSPPPQHHGPPSVVGQEGMPMPAPRPRGPKLKFTPEDDQLLVDLKEKKNLTWKQIADFFPGRSSGTLQVRYCTKLKAKTTVWTDEMVQKLRNAMREYETDRWRIISTKVGSGFSPAACKEKAMELVDPLQQGGPSSLQQQPSLDDLGDLEAAGDEDDGQDDSSIYEQSGHGGMVHGLGEVHGGLGLGGHGHDHGHEGGPGSAGSDAFKLSTRAGPSEFAYDPRTQNECTIGMGMKERTLAITAIIKRSATTVSRDHEDITGGKNGQGNDGHAVFG